MTDAFDTTRAELVRQSDGIAAIIAQREEEIDTLAYQHALIVNRLIGMDDARRLLTEAATEPAPERPAEPAPQPERKRADVQGAVMAYFEPHPHTWTCNESDIIRGTGLPEASVHTFLLRAVRDGMLVKDGSLFRLPATEAVELAAPQAGEPEDGDDVVSGAA